VKLGQHLLNEDNLEVERFVFPAGGESLETCGEVRAKAWCSNCGDYKYELLDHCDRGVCPVCHEEWRTRASRSATSEIIEKFHLFKQVVDPNFSLSSVVWSCPPKMWDWDIDKLWRAFGQLLRRSVGAEATAAIIHLYRFRNQEGQEIPFKEWIRNPSAYVLSREPHFHSIVVGKLIRSDDLYEKTGWVYKKLKNRKGRYWLNASDVFGTVYYALSHTSLSLDKQRQSVHYYGLFKKARIESEWFEYVAMACPICGEHLELHYVKPVIIDDSSVVGFREPWYRKVIHRTYTLPL
jgi:hypothetical protein